MPVKKMGKGTTVATDWLYTHLVPSWNGKKGECPLVAVEQVHAMPKQGVTSMFTFGMGYGKVLAVLEILGWPWINPSPQMWQKLVLKGRTGGKDASIAYCLARYPDVSLKPTEKSKKESHGLADAICLAEYALRQRIKQLEEAVGHVADS